MFDTYFIVKTLMSVQLKPVIRGKRESMRARFVKFSFSFIVGLDTAYHRLAYKKQLFIMEASLTSVGRDRDSDEG